MSEKPKIITEGSVNKGGQNLTSKIPKRPPPPSPTKPTTPKKPETN